jgi:hypothetical protein
MYLFICHSSTMMSSVKANGPSVRKPSEDNQREREAIPLRSKTTMRAQTSGNAMSARVTRAAAPQEATKADEERSARSVAVQSRTAHVETDIITGPSGGLEDNVMVETFRNGHRVSLSLTAALELFWEAEFAWLKPLDWYRWSIHGRTGNGTMFKDAKRGPRVMAYHLMRRGQRGLTLDDLHELDKRSEFIGPEAFHTRMARFNTAVFGKMLPEHRPFEYTEVFNGNDQPISAYRLKPGHEVLLVVGLVPGGSYQPEDIDWTMFQKPPCKLERTSIRRPSAVES